MDDAVSTTSITCKLLQTSTKSDFSENSFNTIFVSSGKAACLVLIQIEHKIVISSYVISFKVCKVIDQRSQGRIGKLDYLH